MSQYRGEAEKLLREIRQIYHIPVVGMADSDDQAMHIIARRLRHLIACNQVEIVKSVRTEMITALALFETQARTAKELTGGPSVPQTQTVDRQKIA